MTNFLALYRGPNPNEAQVVAVTCDPDLIDLVATRLLAQPHRAEDAVVDALQHGRRRALQMIRDDSTG